MVEGLEEVMVSMYAKGMSVSDIQEQIKEIYKFEVSTSLVFISIRRLSAKSKPIDNKREQKISAKNHTTD